MGLSRRRLLQGGAALALSAAAPLRWVAAAGAAPGKTTTVDPWFSRLTYTPLLKTSFAVQVGGGQTAALVLAGVGDIAPPSAKQRNAPPDGRFSLLFTSATSFVQGTYVIHHSALGSSSLFVVPVGGKRTLQSYEVIVNRLT